MGGVFVRADEGQALVVAGLAMVVLMGALAFAVDWGYGFSVHRLAQNQADAAALAAGRLLASSYVGGNPAFGVTEDGAWCAARDARDANASVAPSTTTNTLQISLSSDGIVWTPPVSSVADCTSTGGGTPVPNTTVYVQVGASERFLSLFGFATRQQVDAAASSWVRLTASAAVRQLRLPPVPLGGATVGMPGVGLSGYTTAPNAAIWPLVVYYGRWNPAEPSIRLIWPDASTDGNLYIAPSHFSPRAAPARVHQLVTESDYTGSASGADHGYLPAGPLLNTGPKTCDPTLNQWDTNGGSSLAFAATCDVPNWFYYGYRGSLSISTNWTPSASPTGWGDPATRAGFEGNPDPGEPPVPFPQSRASCAALSLSAFLTAPSCTRDLPESSNIGDWVETVPRASVDEPLIRSEIMSFIDRYGRDVPGGGDKSVVVNVFLWDCAESYDAAKPAGSRWQLDPATGDCSSDPNFATADRVHLLAVVPMTVFESDVVVAGSSLQLTAHWGDVFGDAGGCASLPTPPGCQLNPLMNSAFLVPDPGE